MSNYTKLQLGIAANNYVMAKEVTRKKARIHEAARLLTDFGIEVQDTMTVENHLVDMAVHHINDALRVLSIENTSIVTLKEIKTLARILGRPTFHI